jgi:hypothetical protein
VAIDADKTIRLAIPYLRATQIRNSGGTDRFSTGIGREYFFGLRGNLRNLDKPLCYDLFIEKYVGFDAFPSGEKFAHAAPSECLAKSWRTLELNEYRSKSRGLRETVY